MAVFLSTGRGGGFSVFVFLTNINHHPLKNFKNPAAALLPY